MRGTISLTGSVGTRVVRKPPTERISWRDFIQYGTPFVRDLDIEVRAWRWKNFGRLLRQFLAVKLAESLAYLTGTVCVWSVLALRKIDGQTRKPVDYGYASFRVVTTAGVGFIVDAFQNLVEAEVMRYHGIGTGAVGELVGDTALGVELTTEYNPNNTRATGSLTEGASANIFRTVGTNTLDSGAPAITEHGILSQAATGGGVLLDRSVFAAINLNGANGDALESTYSLTFTSGG